MPSAHVLLVEDEGIVARDISNRLERMGYAVAGVASSGPEALEKTADTIPDVVLMDIKLQGEMDGIEASQSLRQRYDVPIIFLTAYADDQTLDRAKATAPFGYLLKPYQERELRSAIEVALYRHRLEQQLKETQHWLQTLLHAIGDAVLATDAVGNVCFLNGHAERLLGWTQAEAVGKDRADVFKVMNSHTGNLELPTAQALREGCAVSLPAGSVLITPEKDFPIEGTITPIDAEQFAGFAFVFRDISARLRHEELERQHDEQRHQNQKMAAIGRLAGGLAHDFNNLLTVILGNTSLVLSNLDQRDLNHRNLKDAESAAERAAELVRQLLVFSQQSSLHEQTIDLHALARTALARIKPTAANIDFRLDVEPQPWKLRGDPVQLQQAVISLCQNAAEAMRKGGSVHIEIGNISIGSERAAASAGRIKPGDYVRLRLRDTGHGVRAELRPYIFEPFFTTKDPTSGAGLGLALAYGIAERHGGWIECHGDVVPGARFDLYFPRYYQAADVEIAPVMPGGPPLPYPRRRKTILVADDEPMVRDLVRNMLLGLDYDVLLAVDGLDAVEIFQRYRARIDLVILDLTMPRMSGCDAFWRLLELDPHIHVLFSSGYFAEDVPELEHGRVLGFLGKPFQRDEVALRVRTAFERIEGERLTSAD